eukprot:3544314-Pyramimonas_sp.AAC.1
MHFMSTLRQFLRVIKSKYCTWSPESCTIKCAMIDCRECKPGPPRRMFKSLRIFGKPTGSRQ